MPRPEQDVTEAELAVLEALWEGETATIRALTDALYPGGGRIMPMPVSTSRVVVTRKKINNRNAISAIEEVGMSAESRGRLSRDLIAVQSWFAGSASVL